MASAGPGPGITACRWPWISSPLPSPFSRWTGAAACPAPAAEGVRTSEAAGRLAEGSRLGW